MVHDARDRVLLAKSMYGRVLVAVWPALALAQEIWPNLQIHNGARALPPPPPPPPAATVRLPPQARTGSRGRAAAARATPIIIDFRDEQADGNNGRGMLHINRTDSPSTFVETHHITARRPLPRFRRRAARTARAARRSHAACARGAAASWATPEDVRPVLRARGVAQLHISDANPTETTFKIRDSFGLVKAQGDMTSFPVRFHTIAPSKFCVPDDGLEGLSDELMAKRVQKLLAYNDQYKPARRLREEGGRCRRTTAAPTAAAHGARQ